MMKEKIKISMALLALLILFAQKSFAQSRDIRVTYVFSHDSVIGFDEEAASVEALAHHCYGDEYKAFMYIQKRKFIKQKYDLKPSPADPVTLFQNPEVFYKTSAVGGACNNEDFELGTTQGWLAQSGNNPNSCAPPTLNGAGQHTVYSTPILDAKLGFFVGSYFDASTNVTPAGNGFILLNNANGLNDAVKLTKQFIVTSSNALFQYAYLPVIQNGDHPCCEQPGFNIRVTITNTTNNTSTVLACPQISVAIPGASCQNVLPPGSPSFIPTPNDPTWLYHNWQASVIDLTPYIGFQVTLDVVVVDCIYTAHGGYAYFDAKCLAMDILGNGQGFPAGTPSVTLPSCGATSATICAPDGTGPYTWAGPGVVAPYNVPSMSNQCYTTGISNTFTLTMNPPAACQPIQRVVNVTITPAPFIIPNVVQPACGGTAAVVNYTAAGSASVNPVITWSPAPTSTTASQNLGSATFPAGIGIVTLTAKDPLGCKVTTTVEIKPSPQQPTVSILNITGSNSITCITPSVDLTAVVVYTSGNVNYYWASNSFTSTADTITVVNSSTLITLTITDPSNGCTASATTAIQVNTVAPISSLSPVTQSVGCGAGVVATATGVAISPTTNVTHNWYSPGLQTPQTGGGPISIYQPPIQGPVTTSTFELCNNINGCCTSKTLEVISTGGSYPTFSLTSSQTFSIGCSTKSLTTINVVNPQSGSGGVVSFTMLPPSFVGPTYTTGPQASYTVNTPGTYTMIVKDNANNCETRFPVSIIQNTFAPNISSATLSRTLSCAMPSVVLTGVSVNSPTVPIDFNWSFQNGPNPNVINNYSFVVNTQAPFTNSVINTYTLNIQDQNNACRNSTVVTMWQNTRPPNAVITPSLSSLTCATGSINMSNFSTTGILPNTFPIAFALVGELWEGPTPQLPKTNSSSYLAFVPGTYSMTVKDLNNGCSAKTTATVLDERDYPVLTTNTLVALDCGATTSGVKLPVTAVGLAAAAVSATWYPPVPTPSVSGLNTLTLTTNGIGEYVIVVKTNSNSCVSQKAITVINGSLTAGFTPDQTTGFAPLTVNFTNNSASTNSATGTQSITSVWSFGNGTTKTTTTNVTTQAIYTAPGTYSVTMFAIKGSCMDTAEMVIVVDIPSKLEVPNVFTPNGDGSNDLFFVRSSNLTNITAQIFDRWGNKIYELSTDKGNIAWDGKNQVGKEAPDGTYFYTIKATGRDGQSYDTKGTVSLFR